jgi:hypothetical protein
MYPYNYTHHVLPKHNWIPVCHERDGSQILMGDNNGLTPRLWGAAARARRPLPAAVGLIWLFVPIFWGIAIFVVWSRW